MFLALGINIEGQKELPGMWLAENEGAKVWLNVLTELKNRGLNDILIACVDGLKGFRMPSTQYIQKPASSYASCIWCATACASCHGRTTKPSLAT
ncbi:heat-stable enterotoxin EAST1 [Escherichia coli]